MIEARLKVNYVGVDRTEQLNLVAVVFLLVFFFRDAREGHAILLEYNLFVLGIAHLF